MQCAIRAPRHAHGMPDDLPEGEHTEQGVCLHLRHRRGNIAINAYASPPLPAHERSLGVCAGAGRLLQRAPPPLCALRWPVPRTPRGRQRLRGLRRRPRGSGGAAGGGNAVGVEAVRPIGFAAEAAGLRGGACCAHTPRWTPVAGATGRCPTGMGLRLRASKRNTSGFHQRSLFRFVGFRILAAQASNFIGQNMWPECVESWTKSPIRHSARSNSELFRQF